MTEQARFDDPGRAKRMAKEWQELAEGQRELIPTAHGTEGVSKRLGLAGEQDAAGKRCLCHA